MINKTMQRINEPNKYEVMTTIKLDKDFKERCPIAYNLKRKELIETAGVDESEVDEMMSTMEIEVELYYHYGYGFVGLESEAVECLNEIHSPYTGEVFANTDED